LSFKLSKPNPKGELEISLQSSMGYLSNSPDKDNDINVIHSGDITMIGVPHDVTGTDNLGNTKRMKPGNNYKFPGNKVIETKSK